MIIQQKDTLCWQCKKACGKCPWSKNFKPIDGWEAIKSNYKYNGLIYDTYKVINCPKFVKFYDILTRPQLANRLSIPERIIPYLSNSNIKRMCEEQGIKILIDKNSRGRMFYELL